jgi:hypothetical protein
MVNLGNMKEAEHEMGTTFCDTFSSRSSETLLSLPVGVLAIGNCEPKIIAKAMKGTCLISNALRLWKNMSEQGS